MPWFPFYTGDYFNKTMHLTTQEHGAYLLLLLNYYSKGEPLPIEDLPALARLSPGDWEAIRPRIAKFFKVQDGKWFQETADEIIHKATSKHVLLSQAGRRGNEKRWSSPGVSPPDSPPDSPGDRISESESELVPPIPQRGNGNGEPDPIKLRLCSLFRRRPTTPWSAKEIKAFRKIPFEEEELKLVESYYTAHIPKDDFRRRDLGTLLNNWQGEVDRARAFYNHAADRNKVW